MKELNKPDDVGPSDAALRVTEIAELFVGFRQSLEVMIKSIGTPQEHTPKAIITKLNDLQAAHLKVLAAEEAFLNEQGDTAGTNPHDFEAIRADIGRQIDRLREELVAEGVSGGVDRA